jgi:phage-related protein
VAVKGVASALISDATSKWLWFRNDYDARPKAKEEFAKLPVDVRAKLDLAMSRHLSGESRTKDVDHLGSGIYEIRVRHLNNQYRVLFIGWGVHRVVLTVFKKNQQKTPKPDLARAEKRARRWVALFSHVDEAD